MRLLGENPCPCTLVIPENQDQGSRVGDRVFHHVGTCLGYDKYEYSLTFSEQNTLTFKTKTRETSRCQALAFKKGCVACRGVKKEMDVAGLRCVKMSYKSVCQNTPGPEGRKIFP